MGSQVIICTDAKEIKDSVLTVWDECVPDGVDKETWEPNLIKERWLKIVCDGETAGFFSLEHLTPWALQLHMHVQPEYRKHRVENMKALYKWILDNKTIENVLTGMAPECFQSIRRYLIKFGWMYTGFVPNSFLRNGVFHNMHIYTIDMEAMEGYLTCQQ